MNWANFMLPLANDFPDFIFPLAMAYWEKQFLCEPLDHREEQCVIQHDCMTDLSVSASW